MEHTVIGLPEESGEDKQESWLENYLNKMGTDTMQCICSHYSITEAKERGSVISEGVCFENICFPCQKF